MLLNLDIGFLPWNFCFWLFCCLLIFSRSLFNGRSRECFNEAWYYLIQLVVRFCNNFSKLRHLFLLHLHFVDNSVKNLDNPGWGAIRKWPLIRPSPTHTVCSQTKITGSGIWFQRTIVWSGVTSVWGWYDQRSLWSGDGLIRGHFGLGMVWSEVTSVWGWYDQR